MENKSHALAAGAFVLLVTALVMALAAWLARDTRIRDIYEISTRESVTGLSPQAAVRYRGIAVGKVASIGFDPQNKGFVLVRIAVDQDAPLTASTYATLGFQGVTGLAYVQLDDMGESRAALVPHKGQNPRIPLRPSLLSKLSDQGASLLVQVEETARRLNLLLSPENQKVLIGAVHNASHSASQVGELSTRLQTIADAQFGPERTDIPALVRESASTMRALQGTAVEVNKVAVQAGLATQSAATTLSAVGNKLTEKGGALDQISQGSAALAQSAQTLNASTLPRAARAADEAAKTARSVERVVSGLGENPQSLIFGTGNTPPGPGEPGFTAPTPVK